MQKQDESRVIHFAEAQAHIRGSNGERSINFLRRGSLDVNLSRPQPPNQQTPHAQDEVYVIIRGRGALLHEGKRESFEAGDFLFVAAGTEHRFDDFSEDVAYWRVFYGPPGESSQLDGIHGRLRNEPINREGAQAQGVREA